MRTSKSGPGRVSPIGERLAERAAKLPIGLAARLARVAGGEPLADVAGVGPSQLDALYALAHASLTAGRWGAARQVLSMLVALEPHRPRSWAALGVLLDRLGDRREAAAFYAMAAAIEDDADLWVRSAECAAAAGNRRGARRSADAALRLPGATPFARQRAALVLEEVGHDD